MNCWTCEIKLVLSRPDKKDLWACPKCQGEYWECRLCDTIESDDNVKGDNCTTCGRFYCSYCLQHDDNSEFLDDDTWRCSKCVNIN